MGLNYQREARKATGKIRSWMGFSWNSAGRKMLLYFRFGRPKAFPAMLASLDANIWGFLAMPVGVLLCFGPGLFVWLKAELETRPPDKSEDKQ